MALVPLLTDMVIGALAECAPESVAAVAQAFLCVGAGAVHVEGLLVASLRQAHLTRPGAPALKPIALPCAHDEAVVLGAAALSGTASARSRFATVDDIHAQDFNPQLFFNAVEHRWH